MKKLIFIILSVITIASVKAQSPQAFSYYATVRNDAGNPITLRAVSFQFSILRDSATGVMVYQEQHNVTTDQFGAVSLEIGRGTVIYGTFASINWGGRKHFLNVGLDTLGGTFYTDMGTSQFLSVPYSLWATKAGNVFSGDYNDLTNKPIVDGSESKITGGDNIIVSGGGTNIDPYIISERVHYVGESYGGGIVFYVYDNGRHGLIAATKDQDLGIEWYNGTRRYTNTTGDGVNAGEMNTTLIIALQTNDNPVGNFAAKVCADYSVNVDGVTYGDWYLPSRFELALLFIQQDFIGGFDSEYYWSSTEFSSVSAWSQNFMTGVQYNLSKNIPYGVRAIRKF